MNSLTINPGKLSLRDLRQVLQAACHVTLSDDAAANIEKSVACVNDIVKANRTTYGINTGFGLLASTHIEQHDLEKLQRSIVLSHAAGVGAALDDDMVRLIMVLKINSLARGFSGIRQVVLDHLMAMVNAQVYPHIPLKGSVGASGDLAPLAHMSLLLLGEGKARYNGQWLSAADALKQAGIPAIELAPKEGLALLNGTQVSTAFALKGLFEAEDLFAAASVADSGDVLSGGNFHAEPVAMAADNIALAIAEIGSMSERRISMMMDKHMSQLPPFLVKNGGVNSGFMIAQVTAAALCSENKALSFPNSVDSIPTSANQEDHVSMAPRAGARLWEMTENTRNIVAIEWLGACQGLDLRDGLKTTASLETARKTLRDKVAFYEEDRFFAPDIEQASALIEQRVLNSLLPQHIFISLA